jgi:hypothetical protein
MNWWSLESTAVGSSIIARRSCSEPLTVKSRRSIVLVLEEILYELAHLVTVP